jgi:uncharacterized membrane protein YeaQ/YmgE (transglycosylase-associated protein family)
MTAQDRRSGLPRTNKYSKYSMVGYEQLALLYFRLWRSVEGRHEGGRRDPMPITWSLACAGACSVMWSTEGGWVMFYFIWLLAAGLAGWASGKIAGDDGFGTTADILLGTTGAFLVRWSFEKFGVSLHDVYLLLFSVWGAAAFPVAARLAFRHHYRSKGF